MRPLLLLSLLAIIFSGSTRSLAAEPRVHGLWVWKMPAVLASANGAEALRDFAKTNDINEIYVSVTRRDDLPHDAVLIALIDLLHQSHIRVEALLDSVDADKEGKPREDFLALAQRVVAFNEAQPQSRFDGIHLDLEPHQRAENKGVGNLAFLAGMIEAFRGIHTIAAQAHLTVNADIPNKVLKGDLEQRRALLTSVDRLTLMLYELSSPDDGKSDESKVQRLHSATDRYFAMTYEGLSGPGLAPMAIGLRTPDYREKLPAMLKSIEEHETAQPHYLGWAWHCYNDQIK